MGKLIVLACQKPDGNLPMRSFVDAGYTEVFLNGDYYYNDGAVNTINGVTPTALALGDSAATTMGRYTYAYGRTGRPAYASFWTAVDASQGTAKPIHVYAMEDDHDHVWNNNDFNYAVTFKASFPSSAAANDMRDMWRVGVASMRLTHAAYFYNQISSVGNGNIPSGIALSGVTGMTADDFPIKYFINDYDASFNLLQHAVGTTPPLAVGTVLRVIQPDCKSYADQASAVDNSSKTMLGSVQEAWLRSNIQIAQGCDAKATVIWSKDIFNRDNGDGGCAFRTYIDTLMTWIDTNGYGCDHITGDRHNPHVGIARKSLGFAYDATTLCACPSGQGTGGLTQYPENVMSYAANDACVVGTIELDTVARVKYLTMRDAFTLEVLMQVPLKFGERAPSSPVISSKTYVFKQNPAAIRTAYAASGTFTWPASTVAFTNTLPVPLMINVQATMTDVSISTDGGVTFDSVKQSTSFTGGQWVLPPAGQIKLTYSAITQFVTCPVAAV